VKHRVYRIGDRCINYSPHADALVRVPRPDHRDLGYQLACRASRKSFPTFVVYGQPRSSFGSVERRFRRPDGCKTYRRVRSL